MKWDWNLFLKGLVSRKFLVWCVATVALFMGLVDGILWGAITGAYLGVNLLQEFRRGQS